MRHLWSFVRLVVLTAIIGIGAIAGPRPAHATHFRYGHLTWKRVATNTAAFTLTCAFQRDQYPGRASDGLVAVGDRFIENIGGTILDFGDNSSPLNGPGGGGLLFQAVAIDATKNYVIGRALDPSSQSDRLIHRYQQPNSGGSPWLANIDSCCRIIQSNNNSSGEYRVETAVDLDASIGSPVSALPPIMPVSSAGSTFFVPAVDAAGNTLRYRLATQFEAGFGFTQPPGVTIDPITGEYTVPAGLQTGLWSTQIVIEQYDPTGVLIGKVGVDFLLNVLKKITTNPPFFNVPPTPVNGLTLTAPVGRPLSVLISASDPDNDIVTLNTTGAPLGAKQVAQLPVSGQLAVSNLSWTPTLADIGAYSITYTAEDGNGNITLTSLNLRVIEAVQLLEPNGGEAYVAGQQQTIYWQSNGSRRTGGFQVLLSTDGGTSYPTVIASSVPDNSSTSTPGNFKWTPQLSQVSKTCKIRLVNLTDPLDFAESQGNFAITTGESTPQCNNPSKPVAIPDADPTGITVPITVTDDRLIRALTVQVNVDHPFIGDLDISLKAPDYPNDPGPTVRLKRQTGLRGETLDKPFGYGYNLQAPEESMTVFYGRRSKGTWLLTIRDLIVGDVGTFNGACITIIGPNAGHFGITSPNGGERWAIGTKHQIVWSNSGVIGDANVDLSRDNGQTWTTIASVPASTASIQWQVLGPEAKKCLVRVISVDDPAQYAISAATFEIDNPFVKVIQPSAGQAISAGKNFAILWDEVPTDANVTIEWSSDGGSTWLSVLAADGTPATNVPNSGSFLWSVPVVNASAQVRVTPLLSPAQPGLSGTFSIQNPGVNVSAPISGDAWYTYSTHTIQWSTVGVSGNVNVLLSRNNGQSWESLFSNITNTGSHDWIVTGPATTQAEIQVVSVNDPTKTGLSGAFTIKDMSITVQSPNGGEVWGIGTTQNIVWTSSGVPGTVDIQVSRDGGNTFTAIATDVPNGGTYAWQVTGPATDPTNSQGGFSAVVRVQAHGLPAFDVSDQSFRIVNPTITLVAPNGGEQWLVGQTNNITWNTLGVTGQLNIDLSRDNGATWTSLFANVSSASSGLQANQSQAWTVTGPDTSQALIRITASDTGTSVTSQSAFRILTPSLQLTSPAGGEVWYTGTTQALSWTSQGVTGNVKIELSRNGQFETITSSTPNTGNFNWTVSGPATNNAAIRITSLNNPNASSTNVIPFRILDPTIQIGSPFGGEEWLINSTHTITWTTSGPVSNVAVELSRNNGTTWETLQSPTTSGAFLWKVTGPVTTTAIVRIRSLDRPTISDQSHSVFRISAPDLTVTAPKSNSKWKIGSQMVITWTGSVVRVGGGTVDIYLSRNGGNTFDPTPILPNLTNRGTATWFVSGKPIKKGKIKVVWKPDTTVFGVSPGAFSTSKNGK